MDPTTRDMVNMVDVRVPGERTMNATALDSEREVQTLPAFNRSSDRHTRSRADEVIVCDESRVRFRHTIELVQASKLPTQIYNWHVQYAGRAELWEVFDLANATYVDYMLDNKARPLPFGVEESTSNQGMFVVPFHFSSEGQSRFQIQYDTINAFQGIDECKLIHVDILPATIEYLSVRIRGENGMQVSVPYDYLGNLSHQLGVHVEWLETKRTDATTEAEAKRLHNSLKTENGELRYEIVKPIAGLRYGFYIRAVRTNAPLPVSIRQLAADTFFEELPELLERQRNDRNNKWVAYHGAKRLGMAASQVELLRIGREAGLTLDDFLIFRIDPIVLTAAM